MAYNHIVPEKQKHIVGVQSVNFNDRAERTMYIETESRLVAVCRQGQDREQQAAVRGHRAQVKECETGLREWSHQSTMSKSTDSKTAPRQKQDM